MTTQLTDEFIAFDMTKVRALENIYTENIEFILDLLPDINWNSQKQVKDFFNKVFGIKLKNVKIAYLKKLLGEAEPNSEYEEILIGLIEYLRLKYALKNYISCILRYEEAGTVFLKERDGKLVMPNGQPLPKSQEILDCAVQFSAGAQSMINNAEQIRH